MGWALEGRDVQPRMARKKFALHTEPHIAEVGDELAFEFQPEVDDAEFLDAYDAPKSLTADEKTPHGTGATLRAMST